MSQIDWLVLAFTLVAIIGYGLYKSKTTHNLEGYFLSNRSMPWWMVLLSIMGTQASAITFLSAPGQAFTDGMRFVQYYFGLPLAMVIICISFVPLFARLKVYTAYEYLEQRFGLSTRVFTAFLFLLSRGLSTGISIYAPSIILSSLMGWDIFWTNVAMGGLLIIYTVSGGAKAVAYTQQLQLAIIFGGMLAAGYYMVAALPEGMGWNSAMTLSGASGKLNVITTGFTPEGFDWKDRYNLLSGLVGGCFLALSYFGTDQSQVGRYLTAKNTAESRMGLLLNGLVKIPMQFFILLLGALLFVFYQFNASPVFFNRAVEKKAFETPYKDSLLQLKGRFDTLQLDQLAQSKWYLQQPRESLKDSIRQQQGKIESLRKSYKKVLAQALPGADTNDTNYVFLRFVVDQLPRGLVGLLVAIIFLAAWGSIAAALNALASCSMIDFHQRFFPVEDQGAAYRWSKWYTFFWGLFCIVTAQFASGLGSLIEAVNVLGSLFYGVILGIFLVAFYLPSVKGKAVFWAAVLGELVVVALFVLDKSGYLGLGFLWLNVVGAVLVLCMAYLFQIIQKPLGIQA